MALAILETIAIDPAYARFHIDTGSNRYYQFKLGNGVRRKHGIDWVDEVFHTSPLRENPAGGDLLRSSQEVTLPLPKRERGPYYVQLFTYKGKQGQAPAFSRVVKAAAGVPMPDQYFPLEPLSISSSLPRTGEGMRQTAPFHTPRTQVPLRTPLSAQASLDDLLGAVVKAAAPIVLNLLKGPQPGPQAPGTTAPADALTTLLQAILGKLGVAGPPAVSQPKSLSLQQSRFTNGHGEFSRPFIFGIDDALLASLAGPVLQMLPQLMNAANQKRLQTTTANNKLVTDILSGINQRLMLEKLAEIQKQAPTPGSPDLTQLIALLQQAPAPAPPAPATPPPAPLAHPKSWSLSDGRPVALSSRAVLSFVPGHEIVWNGSAKQVFRRDGDIRLDVRLSVAPPAPAKPLPKAILRLVFKDTTNQSILFEKTFRRKDVAADAVIPLACTREELARLPANRCLAVLAEMRWLSGGGGRDHKAVGATDVVLVNESFLKEKGPEASPERELTDLRQFRAFWNKLWESPSLDAAATRNGAGSKLLWELDVNARYSVLLTTQASNGLIETRLLPGPADSDSVTHKTSGRMKAGIELNIAELNKLLPLWDGASPLSPEALESINVEPVADGLGGEFITNIRLKGRKRERGLVWVVPVFKLFEFTLSHVATANDSGQVVAVTEEKTRFPLPVSARVIGLKSKG